MISVKYDSHFSEKYIKKVFLETAMSVNPANEISDKLKNFITLKHKSYKNPILT